jgi:uncharacterized membrane protein YdjX (TVP38/TMEM64 family)
MTQIEVPEPAARASLVRWILIGIAAVAAIYAIRLFAGAYLEDFKSWVQTLGVWGPIVFIIGYAVGTVAFIPGTVLTLAAGAIFGVVAGTAYVFVAATLGACSAFLVARYFARSSIEHRIAGNQKFSAIDRAIAGEGRKITFLLRLSPVFPFNLLNYALGLTRVSFADYTIASIGMIPGTLLYVYLGSIAGLAASGGGEKSPLEWAFLALGLLATVVVTLLITRMARRALDEATAETN